MLNCQKERFQIPEEVCFLNTAYMSPQLKELEAIGKKALSRKNQPFNFTTADFFEPVEKVKANFARLIEAKEASRIAIVPSVSYGMANVANNVKLTDKSEIVVLEEQFPSNIYIWMRRAKETGASLKIIPTPQGAQDRGKRWNQALLDAITAKTAVVAIPNVHWSDGTLFDLKTIRAKTNQYDAMLVIDGTQSVGALPFSVQDLQPDALVCSGYKWLLGPYGLGVAYYGERFDGGVPIEENWINRLDSENFAGLINYQEQYKPMANRYSMGEQSNFVFLPMMDQAYTQIQEWGVANIQAYCGAITHQAIEQLQAAGFSVSDAAYRANHLFGIKIPEGVSATEIKNKLQEEQIFVSIRGNYIRIAPYVFNTASDLDRLVACLESVALSVKN